MILLDSEQGIFKSPIYSQHNLILEYGEEFPYITLWSEPGKDFVCVEPWMAKPNAINTKEDLVTLNPRMTMDSYFRISCKDR